MDVKKEELLSNLDSLYEKFEQMDKKLTNVLRNNTDTHNNLDDDLQWATDLKKTIKSNIMALQEKIGFIDT